ncbi:MAG: putative tryptophan/tyrosine transport system substrate-binding protein [Thermodesulfobacteriota bacterium]|nr:putative tryptophan/tyrosine transport system substrate-binding protein [Thermodesulfobacteriota bacterium]
MIKQLSVPLSIIFVFMAAFSFAENKKMIRIGVTQIVSHAALDADQKGFEKALSSAGFKEGVNIIYDRQNAQGDMVKANTIAKKFNDEKVDLIHAIATPTTQVVTRITKKIPVVFSSITDPVDAGIVPKDSSPGKKSGTNVTGVSDRWPVFLQMEMYAKFVPKVKQWGTIYNAGEANSVVHIGEMREAAKKLGLELVEVTISNRSEVAKAALSLAGKVKAIVISSDNTAISDFDTIVKICNEKKIALFAGDVDSVPKGATAAYGLDYFLVGYSAGKKAALVLKGQNPGDIPWGPMEKFSLVINSNAAKAQGVIIPPDLLKKADKVLN